MPANWLLAGKSVGLKAIPIKNLTICQSPGPSRSDFRTSDKNQLPTQVFGVPESSPSCQGLTWHQGLPGKALWVIGNQQRLTATVVDGLFPGFSEGVRLAMAGRLRSCPGLRCACFLYCFFIDRGPFGSPNR